MKDMTLSQLMRFGLAGGIYLGALLLGFVEARAFAVLPTSGLVAGVAAAVALVVGSIVYTVHRALLFPLIRKGLFGLIGEKKAAIDFDLERWALARDLAADGSLLRNLSVWADQIHFLYCSSWAGFLAWATGCLLGWTASNQFWSVPAAAVSLLAVAVAYNLRYQRYEQRAIQADRDRVAQLTSASS